MISLLRDCLLHVDNGHYFDGEECYLPHWEHQEFLSGEEIDEFDSTIDIKNLTEGEDFVRL